MKESDNQTALQGYTRNSNIFFRSHITLIIIALSCNVAVGSSPNKPNDVLLLGMAIPEVPGMQLVWNDEFNTDGPADTRSWNYEYGFVRNQELQWYQAQNAQCKNGALVIEARKETIDNPEFNPLNQNWKTSRKQANYTSACLTTKGLQEWPASGYFEIRARVDSSKGSWPAIWLLGTEGHWPDSGEIDIMEFYRINNVPQILANVAWGSPADYKGEWDSSHKELSDFLSKDPDWVKKFHTWSMKWDQKVIQLFLDGELLNDIPLKKTLNPDGRNPFTIGQKFYLLLNLAIGSNGGDPSRSAFPMKFEVDYVRVYKSNTQN